ncbi:MAG TPA: 30S ribosome-binding factor RbfA [Rhizobiales bacterium]|nr:30S ribosome-binding factor RbfA [Hyphomicrobiales bacterium]
MAKASEPSQRQLRVGELVRHALSEIFARGETNDPDLEKSGVTVLEVSMAPDLKQARAYVRPLYEGHEELLMDALKRNKKYLRKLLSPRLGLKFMPNIRFMLDTAPDHARRIDDILHDPRVMRDLQRTDEPDGA